MSCSPDKVFLVHHTLGRSHAWSMSLRCLLSTFALTKMIPALLSRSRGVNSPRTVPSPRAVTEVRRIRSKTSQSAAKLPVVPSVRYGPQRLCQGYLPWGSMKQWLPVMRLETKYSHAAPNLRSPRMKGLRSAILESPIQLCLTCSNRYSVRLKHAPSGAACRQLDLLSEKRV